MCWTISFSRVPWPALKFKAGLLDAIRFYLLNEVWIFAIGGIGRRLGAGWHGGEDDEIGLHLGPLRRILFGRDGRGWIRVVSLNVLLDARRNRLRRLVRKAMEEIGVGGVGERIPTGLHRASGVEIAIGEGGGGGPGSGAGIPPGLHRGSGVEIAMG